MSEVVKASPEMSATLQRLRAEIEVDDRQEGEFTVRDAADEWGTARKTAYEWLERLIAEGRVTKRRSGKRMYYREASTDAPGGAPGRARAGARRDGAMPSGFGGRPLVKGAGKGI